MALRNPFTDKAEFQRQIAHTLRSDHFGSHGSDHIKEAKAFQGANYLAINTIGRLAAKAVGYVYDATKPQLSTLRKSLQAKHGTFWRSYADQGVAQTVSDEHWVAQLVNHPNPSQSKQAFQWEFIQQLHLHGCCLIFDRESADGSRVVARYIVPMAMTQPVYAGQYSEAPNGGVRIMPSSAGLGFYIHPMIRSLSGRIIPAEMLSVIRYPDPLIRGDGKSPTDACGWWIDTSNMIDQARWKQLKRGPRPHGIITVEGDEVTEDQLDDVEKRLNRKMGDDTYDQRCIAVANTVNVPTEATPVEMDYVQAFDQLVKVILSTHGANAAAAGLTDNMTYGSQAAAIDQCVAFAQTDLDFLAGDYTLLARYYGENVEVQFEVPSYRDPQLIEQQIQNDIQAGGITLGQLCALRGRPPFGDWRDNARVTPQGLVYDTEPPKAPSAAQPAFGEAVPKSLAKSMSKTGYGRSAPGQTEFAPIVAIDLDGTLAEESGTYDPNYIGNPIESRVLEVRRLKDAGCQICIFTCRDSDDLVAAWLDAYGIPWDAINANPEGFVGSGKVFAHVYWDNRAINADEPLREVAKRLPEGVAKQILLETTKAEQKLGCIMFEMPASVAAEVAAEHASILQVCPQDLRDEGLEGEPHVTLLYGLAGCSADEVVEQVKRINAFEVSFGRISTFDKEDGTSVVKYEIESDILHAHNATVRGCLPYVETYPEYRPHMTLAYMASDSFYVESLPRPGSLTGKSCLVTSAVISIDGQKIRVPLRRTPETESSPLIEGGPRVATVDQLIAYGAKSAGSINTIESGLPIREQMAKSMTAKRIFEDLKQTQATEADQRFAALESKIETLAKSLPTVDAIADVWSQRLEKLLDRRDPERIEGTPLIVKQKPIAAGLAVVALDTGRVLLLQRALTEGDPAAGKWECPGGHIDEGEDPWDAAYREYCEEVGQPLPMGSAGPVAVWDCGKYVGHVMTVPSESAVMINAEPLVLNPDNDPDGDGAEVVAWWSLDDMQDNPAIRQELSETFDLFSQAIGQVTLNPACDELRKSLAKGSPNQPRDDNGRWVSQGSVRQVAGDVNKASELFKKVSDPKQQEKLTKFLVENGMSVKDAKAAQAKGTGAPAKSRPQQKQMTDKTKSAIAKASMKRTDKTVQDVAKKNEYALAKALGGEALPDSAPHDVETKTDFIEVKTMVTGENQKLTMNKYAQVLKITQEQKQKKPFHTIVYDDTEVFKTGDESKRKIYYRRGVAGSARIASMHEVKGGVAELKQLMRAKEASLPSAAQRTDGALRKGRWVPMKDQRGFTNSLTGETALPKK